MQCINSQPIEYEAPPLCGTFVSDKRPKLAEGRRLMIAHRRLLSGDFSDDNLNQSRVLLNRDNPVSHVTHALGVPESMYLHCLIHIK